LDEEARERVRDSRRLVERMTDEARPVYGVTTGFGALATTRIPRDEHLKLQRSLLRSHAAGMGPFVEAEAVRAMMAIRAKTLAAGYSGVRPELVEALVSALNAGLTPAVPEHGSMGASGDLAPLAHVGLCLTGEGWALQDGEAVPAREALERAGLKPVEPQTKEGLALINGTDGMLALLILALEDLGVMLKTADVTAAMSVEALLGTDRVFREELHALRPHPGQLASARNISRMLAGAPSSPPTATPYTSSRTPTRCAALPPSTARPGTPWITPRK
jgi:histidine ammonia-lyase